MAEEVPHLVAGRLDPRLDCRTRDQGGMSLEHGLRALEVGVALLQRLGSRGLVEERAVFLLERSIPVERVAVRTRRTGDALAIAFIGHVERSSSRSGGAGRGPGMRSE